MVPERRRKRSNFVGLALQYWLSAIARSKDIFTLVLADSAGLLIAASSRGPEAEELAAMAPLLVRHDRTADQDLELLDMPLRVKEVQVDKNQFYVCALGDRQRIQEGAHLASCGVERILRVH